MKVRSYAVLLAATLGSSAVAAQELPRHSLGVTFGPTAFGLRGVETGLGGNAPGRVTSDANAIGLGGTFGLSGGFSAGVIGDFDVGFGVTGFATIGQADSTVVDHFSGPGTVTLGGYATPGNAALTLGTFSDPSGSAAGVSIDHTNPQGGGELITLATAGTTDVFGTTVAGGGNSFALAAVTTRQGAANTAAAYGAIAATDGGVFFGAGDLTGLSATTTTARSLLYTGADLTVALSSNTGSVAFQGYVGPSYRFLAQTNRSSTSFDIPEATTGPAFPTFALLRDERLTAHYIGGVAGANLSMPVSDALTFSLGLEGGLYYERDTLEGRESYSLASGTGVPLASVSNSNGMNLAADGMAWSGKVSPSITLALAGNRQLTFGGAVDYLSRVASVTRDGSVATSTNSYAGSDDGTLSYTAATQTATALSFAPMWSFSPSVSFTGQF